MARARQIELDAAHPAREFARLVCREHATGSAGRDDNLDAFSRQYSPAAG